MVPPLSAEPAIVILGAGPAGLACAQRVLRESKRRPVIVDKARFVGGAGASFRWKEYTLDYGPHAFHARGDQPETMVRDLFASEPEALIEGRKHVHVLLRGRRFRYPLQVREALLRFNPLLSLRIIVEFIATSLIHALVSIPVENFENWGRKRFGPTLYRMSFGDYTEKVWKTRPDRISEKFAAEKIQGFSFITLIKRLLRVGGQVTEPYYQTWIYHRHGSGQIYEKLAADIVAAGGEIVLGADIEAVRTEGKKAACVRLKQDGQTRCIPCDSVISTIPLPQLVGLMGDDVPFIVRHAASKLRYSSLIVAYLELDVEKVSDDHWFYLLDREFRFNRVTEQKNLSAWTMAPGKTVLSMELTCRLGDETWRLSDEEVLELAKADCRRIPFVPVDRITDGLVKRVPNVYEIYYKDFDRHADVALGYLMELENVISIGRRGLFLQGDMHQSVEMGLAMGELVARHGPDAGRVRDFYRTYVRYLDL